MSGLFLRLTNLLGKNKMKTPTLLLITVVLSGSLALARPADEKRQDQQVVENAGDVMQQVLSIPDDIPRSILDRARCVAVMPSVFKAAFLAGGSYGRGVMVCRSGKNFDGPWGAPAMYVLEAGSFGLQIGGEAIDFVILVMNEQAVQTLLNGKIQLGGDASIAAGPTGRTAAISTDTYAKAEFLSYSRSKGVFAGLSLEGSSLRPDDNANHRLYGEDASAAKILTGSESGAPASAKQLLSVLEKASPQYRP